MTETLIAMRSRSAPLFWFLYNLKAVLRNLLLARLAENELRTAVLHSLLARAVRHYSKRKLLARVPYRLSIISSRNTIEY